MRRLSAALTASTLLLLAVLGCERAPERVIYERPNVLVITLDTVRADRVGCYGYPRETTPNLDRLAEESVRFSRAFSQSSFTPPSHASILSSRYPSSHGVMWWDMKMPDEVVTIAELFSDADYRTASVSPLGMSRNGLGQGFNRVIEMKDLGDWTLPIEGAPPYQIASAEEINKVVERWIAAEDERPFMAWVHYYDAHRPFSIFSPERHFCDDKGSSFGNHTSNDYQLSPEERQARGIGEAEARYLENRYDSGLRGLDARVGELLDALRADGTLDRTILVVTSDHGEAFAEFDDEWFTHDPFLYDAITHVPLLIRFPDGQFAGQIVDSLAALIDVAPTVLDYCGRGKADGMQGLSLRPAIEEERAVNAFVASERRGQDADSREPDRVFEPSEIGFRRSVRSEKLRLLVEEAGGEIRLYDLRDSTVERDDLFDAEEPRSKVHVDAYRDLVRRLESLRPTLDLNNLSPEDWEELRKNGYVGK